MPENLSEKSGINDMGKSAGSLTFPARALYLSYRASPSGSLSIEIVLHPLDLGHAIIFALTPLCSMYVSPRLCSLLDCELTED